MFHEIGVWGGGDLEVSVTGTGFDRGARIVLKTREVFPGGRVAGGSWARHTEFGAPVERERFNLVPCVYGFEIPNLGDGSRPDVRAVVHLPSGDDVTVRGAA